MRILLFALLAILPFLLQAQDSTIRAIRHRDRNENFSITVSPLAIAQIDYTLLVGGEYRLNDKINLVSDIGWIYGSSFFGKSNGLDRKGTGFIFRPGVKLFITEIPAMYLQAQFFFKQVTHSIYDWLDKEVVNGVGAYQKLQDFQYRRKVHGFNAIFGVIKTIGTNDHFFIDLYFGLGVRNKWSEILGEKNSRYLPSGVFSWISEQDGSILPSLPIGLRLIYSFN